MTVHAACCLVCIFALMSNMNVFEAKIVKLLIVGSGVLKTLTI